MYKVNKNDKAFKELDAYAKKNNKTMKEVLLDDSHLEKVCDIFYEHMPKVVKWSMKKEKFVNFYKDNRETFVSQMKLA
jgi:hypothetical protein